MSSSKTFLALIIVIVIAGLAWLYMHKEAIAPSPAGEEQKTGQNQSGDMQSLMDMTVDIEGQRIPLVNGMALTPAAPGSASAITTRYFGNEATGDLNADGSADVAFLVTQGTGGSGTFYYVVAALKTANGYTSTNSQLLGDRIAPQSTQVQTDASGTMIVVNYAQRKDKEPMTAQPSVGVSRYFRVENGSLIEVTKK